MLLDEEMSCTAPYSHIAETRPGRTLFAAVFGRLAFPLVFEENLQAG
jgi:hypothetical protein